MDLINWNEAPDDATHHLRCVHGGNWWIKVGDAAGYYHMTVGFHRWIHSHKDFFKTYENNKWVVVTRPQIQPKQQGEHKMFTAKQLKDTYPHKQMRMHIEATVADAAKRPAALGQLVKKFMANCMAQRGHFGVPDDVDEAFIWGGTPEGHDFWRAVQQHKPRALGVAHPAADIDVAQVQAQPKVFAKKEAKKPEPAPKQQVGWW